MSAEERAKLIKMIILDTDGVLTDGGLFYDDKGRVSKRFDIHDGMGIKLAQAAGLEVAVITGLDSNAVKSRLKELGVTEYYPGHREKLPILEELRQKHGLDYKQIAFMGDDWVDASVMARVGLPMTVSDAQPEIEALALWTSKKPGGHGAVREAIRFILKSQGKLERLWRRWLG